jgi:hypothetical protein
MPDEARIKSIKGSALNLSPLARLLRPDQLLPLMFAAILITGKEMLRCRSSKFLFKGGYVINLSHV